MPFKGAGIILKSLQIKSTAAEITGQSSKAADNASGKAARKTTGNVKSYKTPQRNPIEGKFGQAKTAYVMNRIKARLQQTSESWIGAISNGTEPG